MIDPKRGPSPLEKAFFFVCRHEFCAGLDVELFRRLLPRLPCAATTTLHVASCVLRLEWPKTRRIAEALCARARARVCAVRGPELTFIFREP